MGGGGVSRDSLAISGSQGQNGSRTEIKVW